MARVALDSHGAYVYVLFQHVLFGEWIDFSHLLGLNRILWILLAGLCNLRVLIYRLSFKTTVLLLSVDNATFRKKSP